MHPSIGQPLRWVVAGLSSAIAGTTFGAEVGRALTIAEGGCDAIVLDWMAASYLAPGIKPRPHCIVVRPREPRPQGFPPLIIVGASYPSEPTQRPSGVDMLRTEGRLVADAIIVGRSLGLVLETVLVQIEAFEMMAQNEKLEVGIAAREFFESAMAAVTVRTTK